MSTESTLAANRIHLTYRNSLLQLADAMGKYAFLNKKEQELRALAANLQSPFNVAVFGRMKTGKSTLINALIGRQLAITGVEEATATINRISYASGKQLETFTVHWQATQPETFPIKQLHQDWTGKSPEVLDRVRRAAWLELYSDAPALRDIHITDTPGTGADVAEHETIAKQFINGQEADALLYVFSPTGRESDESDLEAFRLGCLPGSSLDNSIAVLHKWDHIYWNEDNWESIESKANRVHGFMQDLVSCVIPISAPLGLIAKTAPESFWQDCRELLSTFADEQALKHALRTNILWKRNPQQLALSSRAEQQGCPWSSFCVLLRHLYRHPGTDEARAILELSGILRLEQLLDKQIFSVRSVIQQKQNCARARKLLDDVYRVINSEQERQQDNIKMMEKIYSLIDESEIDARRWLDNLQGTAKWQHQQLAQDSLSLDRLRIRIRDWADAITNAHDLIPWLKDNDGLPLQREVADLCVRILKSLLPNGESTTDISRETIVQLLPAIARLANLPCVSDKHKAERLRKCLMYWGSQSNHS